MRLSRFNLQSLNTLSFLMLVALLISKITGQIRVIIVGQKLGFDSLYADAFSQGFLMPDLIFALLVGGSIQATIVPYLARHIANKKEEEAWQALSSFITIVALSMAIFLGLAYWQTPYIMKFFTSHASYEASIITTLFFAPSIFYDVGRVFGRYTQQSP